MVACLEVENTRVVENITSASLSPRREVCIYAYTLVGAARTSPVLLSTERFCTQEKSLAQKTKLERKEGEGQK